MGAQDIVNLIQSGGPVAMFVLLSIALIRGDLALGRELRKAEQRADRMEALALRGTRISETTAKIAAEKEGS